MGGRGGGGGRNHALPVSLLKKIAAVVAGLASYVGLNLDGKMTGNIRRIQGFQTTQKRF